MFQKLISIKNGQKIYIRPFWICDVLSLHRMYRSLSEESKKFFFASFFEFTGLKWFFSNLALLLSTFAIIRRFLAYLWPKTASSALVAVDNRNELIGFVYLRLKERSIKGNRNHRAALGICVRDDYQNAGLGSNLLDLAIELAEKEKIREICAWILSENVRSIHFFQKFGFKATRLVKRCTCWKSKYYDCLEMRLRLC